MELIRRSGDIAVGLSTSNSRLWYISLHSALLKGSQIKVTALDPSTGKQTGLTRLSSDTELTTQDMILYIGNAIPLLIWTDKALKVLKINIIGTKHVTNIPISSQYEEQIQKISVHAPQAAAVQAHFLVHYQSTISHWAEVYHVNVKSGTAKKAFDLPRVGGHGAFSTSAQGTSIYFTRNTEFEVSLVSSATSDVLVHWPVRTKSHGGLVDLPGISHAVSEVVSKGGSSFAVRSALVLTSGDWELIRNGDPLWVRPEGLTGVIAAAFAEYPADHRLAEELAVESHSSIFAAYAHRIRRHARDLKELPAWSQSLFRRIKGTLFGDASYPETQGRIGDGFGFQKLVIIATDRGRVMALDTGNQGQILWNVDLVYLSLGEKWKVSSIEIENRIAIVRGYEGELWRVQVLDGVLLQHQPSGVFGSVKATVSVLDSSGGKFSVPVHNDGSLGYYPKDKLIKGTLIVTRGDQGVVRGWSLDKKSDPAVFWEFVPGPSEIISNVVARPTYDPVASIGKALGDRNVLYKYVNPNILLITTIDHKSSTMIVYILNSASGQILHMATHSNIDTSRPVKATLSENWFAYSLFSDAIEPAEDSSTSTDQISRGYQLIVSEMFESQYPNDRGPLGAQSNFSSIYPVASENGETDDTPHVISQTYSITGSISQMSATSTLQGITPRSLLCFLPSLNALIAIPRAVLDPRRPVGRDPTPAELEEGLFKHNAILDFEPKWIVSHKRDILSLSEIITTPSLLESTSLVFTFGDVDIFGTRIAPIGAFDMLGKGFSKIQLIGTVIALAIGTGIVAPMVRNICDSKFFLGGNFSN